MLGRGGVQRVEGGRWGMGRRTVENLGATGPDEVCWHDPDANDEHGTG